MTNRIPTRLAATALAILAGAQTMANEARDLIATFYAAVDAPDRPESTLVRFFAPDFVDHDRPSLAPPEAPDRAVALNLFAELATGFPGAVHRLDILEPLGPDQAVVYWTFEGVHAGPFFGAPASQRAVSINGIDIFRVWDGQFVEQWHVEELMDLFAQIAPR